MVNLACMCIVLYYMQEWGVERKHLHRTINSPKRTRSFFRCYYWARVASLHLSQSSTICIIIGVNITATSPKPLHYAIPIQSSAAYQLPRVCTASGQPTDALAWRSSCKGQLSSSSTADSHLLSRRLPATFAQLLHRPPARPSSSKVYCHPCDTLPVLTAFASSVFSISFSPLTNFPSSFSAAFNPSAPPSVGSAATASFIQFSAS
jgi:hypothetical protein